MLDEKRTEREQFIADAIVRLREELAQSEGCHYVGPPLTTLDEYGFLKEEFWAYDLTHANFEYGDRALCEAISYSQQMMFDNSK